MINWSELCQLWTKKYGCKIYNPVSEQLVERIERELGALPSDLKDFYRATNGIENEGFKIFPIEDPEDIKRTWDGLLRANDPKHSIYLNADSSLLESFLIFSHIGVGECAAFQRTDNSIWYEEGDQFHQTDLDLAGFIESVLHEIELGF